MSSETTGMEETSQRPEVGDYEKVFPALPGGLGGAAPATTPQPIWSQQPKMYMPSSTVTQVFCVPVEERRFKEMAEQEFGEKGRDQARVCQNIMNRTDVTIEMSMAKDQSLTVVISGKVDRVMLARKMISQQLQTQANATVKIPKEHHRYILGPKGKRLQDLELCTATKITVPRQEENLDVIKIQGTKEGIEKARHEIQIISDEQAKLAFERLPIEKIYHPFIQGPSNATVRELMDRTAARISIPPLSVQKDEIVVSGEKEGVQTAINTIMAIYKEKKRTCQTVSVEVRKSQHKYVIGPKGSNLSDILSQFDVSVEVPPLESTSETITLRGEQDKLGPALTMVYSKANSVIVTEVEAPSWLHRFIIGKKGANIQLITQDLPKVHIEFTDGQDKIVVEGPPEEVKQAQKALEAEVKDLLTKMAFAEIEVDQKYHRHIIGKNGANVTRLKNETGVQVRIPGDQEASSIIRIEGSPEGVATAKKELIDMVTKMENEKSRDILIEQRFHRSMIGAAGGKIKEIRDKFNQVQITFPDPGKKSDVVTLRGPKTDVDKAYKYLTQMTAEMVVNNYQAEVHIFKQFHKNVIGKGGGTIRKIRDETDTRIDLPNEASDSDVITITGKRENVEKARTLVEAIQKDLANIAEIQIDIPHKFHNSMIGAGGRLIRSIMEECGGVIIRFPPAGSTSDKVVIRGPKEDAESAKKQLMELAAERKESGHIVEVRAKSEYHKFLIGRGGSNIRKVRESTGARVMFPSNKDTDRELITIIGTKESAEKARGELEDLIKDLENIVEGEIDVDPKHHRHFVARRGEVLRVIADEYGGVTVSFPRSGVKSSKVTLKGAKDCVDGAMRRIGEIVADLDAQVTIECVIEQRHHRTVMGAKGSKVQEITKEFDVGIKFPDRPQQAQSPQSPKPAPAADAAAAAVVPPADAAPAPEADAPDAAAPPAAPAEEVAPPVMNGDVANGDVTAAVTENGDGDAGPRKCDTILITGKQENCDAAAAALQDLVPITEEMPVAYDLHRFIIGQKGRDVRKMMEENDVNISIPPQDEKTDIVRITGAPKNVRRAMTAMEARIEQLEGEKKDRELRGWRLEMNVDPMYHPKIIGRRGAVISKIRDQHQVNIQFPDKGSETPSLITITGYEESARAAETDIMQIVTDLEDMVTEDVEIDHRIHSRLIGQRGKAIRNIMTDYKVDIKFPNRESGNPDVVQITGAEDNVLDCKDHLLNLTEEYMQDVRDQEMMEEYTRPSRDDNASSGRSGPNRGKGFVVTGAPWHNTPDMASQMDFPDLGAAAAAPTSSGPTSGGGKVSWGPSSKR